MAKSTYDEALRRLLVAEGGYTNHPADPGGPTNFGITIADYRRYAKPDATAADVRAMKVGEAKAIYRARYWDAMRCDELPAGIDYCVFDYGVNSGISRAIKVLQRVLQCPVTGRADDAAIRCAQQCNVPSAIAAICDERLSFLRGLKTWAVFGAGWGRRVREVRAAALAMAGSGAPARGSSSAAPGKGVVPVNTRARNGATAGAIAVGGAAAAQTSDATVALVTLAVTIVVAVGAWAFWHWSQQRQQDAPVAAAAANSEQVAS